MIIFVSCLSSGLSVVSSDTLITKKVLSTRYPERSPRVYIKNYFGMHPTITTQVNLLSLSHIPELYIPFCFSFTEIRL